MINHIFLYNDFIIYFVWSLYHILHNAMNISFFNHLSPSIFSKYMTDCHCILTPMLPFQIHVWHHVRYVSSCILHKHLHKHDIHDHHGTFFSHSPKIYKKDMVTVYHFVPHNHIYGHFVVNCKQLAGKCETDIGKLKCLNFNNKTSMLCANIVYGDFWSFSKRYI